MIGTVGRILEVEKRSVRPGRPGRLGEEVARADAAWKKSQVAADAGSGGDKGGLSGRATRAGEEGLRCRRMEADGGVDG
jgi:hypothetical protein